MRPEWSDRAFTRGNSCTAEDGLRSQYVPSTIERRLSHLVRRNPGLERSTQAAACWRPARAVSDDRLRERSNESGTADDGWR